MLIQKAKLGLFVNFRKLSSLANAFNSNDYIETNKKYSNEKLSGLFGIDDLKIDGGIEAMKYKAESDCQILLKEALSSFRQRKIVEILDDISDSICQVADLSECIRLLHPDANNRTRFSNISQSMSRIVEIFNTNQQLFSVIDKVVKSNQDVQPLDKIDKAVLLLLHRDFQASGIHLHDNERKKFLESTQLAVEIGSDFHTNTECPVKMNASVLSKEMQRKLNLDPNQTIEITHPYLLSHDSYVRELGYRGFYSNNPDQEERLRCLLECRYNVGKYSGYDSFSERANMSMICETPEKVQMFISNLSKRLLSTAEKDRIKMLNLKYNSKNKIDSTNLYGVGNQLLPWDLEYFTYRLKQESMPGGYERYQPYFSLGACIEGISQLLDAHFSVGMELQEAIPGELWHPDVFKLVLYQKPNPNMSGGGSTGILGTVYCDLFARKGKLSNDCHFTVRAGRSLDNGESYQKPIVVLQANLGQSSDRSGPVFLTPPQVESLFHEWGHALHSILTHTRYQHAAGTRCSTDLAEAPSTLMELFAMDRRVVKEYARNEGQQMSEDMLLGLEKQKQVGVAINQQQTLVLSMFDQLVHGIDLPVSSEKSSKVFNNLFSANNAHSNLLGSRVFDLPSNSDEIYYGQRFSHLLNYGARFYSYSLSNCIAGYIWRSGFDKDPWSSSLGHKYRETILQHGGQYKPLEMLSEFSGKDSVTVENLVDDYVDNIEAAYDIL